MRLRVVCLASIVAAVSCAGARGALDTVGPELGELYAGDASRALYFGEGCYAVHDQRGDRPSIYACSIDVLPIGQLICMREPADGFAIRLHDRELATFERELNQHRCHHRWQEQVVCDPVRIEARESAKPIRGSQPWPADLGVLHATLDLSPTARADIFGHRGERLEADVALCTSKSGALVPSIWYFIGHGTTPFYQEVLDAITDGVATRSGRPHECTTAHLTVTGIRCSVGPQLATPRPQLPRSMRGAGSSS